MSSSTFSNSNTEFQTVFWISERIWIIVIRMHVCVFYICLEHDVFCVKVNEKLPVCKCFDGRMNCANSMCMSLRGLDPWETVVGSGKAQPSGSNRTLRAHGTVWENSPNQSRRQDFPLTCGLYLTRPVSVQMSLERCTPTSNVLG